MPKNICVYTVYIPSISTPSEWAFSTAGNIITLKINCLAGETAKWLIFLSHNAKL